MKSHDTKRTRIKQSVQYTCDTFQYTHMLEIDIATHSTQLYFKSYIYRKMHLFSKILSNNNNTYIS